MVNCQILFTYFIRICYNLLMKKLIRRLLFIFFDIVLVVFILLGIFTIIEYRPRPIENVDYIAFSEAELGQDIVSKKISEREPISIITWNLGYASLSEQEDFFLDGGEKIRPDSIEVVEKNLKGISDLIQQNPVDFWLFQEIDEDAKRSYFINQRNYLSTTTQMGSAYAYNFKASYVPFPLPAIGKVEAGIGTYSMHKLENSQRISLPVPFIWPVRTVNMKRCLLLSRVSLDEHGKELVLINLHLEAYDDGEGQKAQTKILMDTLKREYEKGNYVVAGGDFNQWFPSVSREQYPQDENYWSPGNLTQESLPSQDWQYSFDDTTPTGRSLHAPYDKQQKDSWVYYVIDGFIVSPNITIKSVKTLDEGFEFSDHNPVLMEIILEN